MSESRADILEQYARKHGLNLNELIDHYLTLGVLVEKMLEEDGNQLVVKNAKTARETVIPLYELMGVR